MTEASVPPLSFHLPVASTASNALLLHRSETACRVLFERLGGVATRFSLGCDPYKA